MTRRIVLDRLTISLPAGTHLDPTGADCGNRAGAGRKLRGGTRPGWP